LARRAGTHIQATGSARMFPPYLVLLRVGFTMPPALQRERCALTAPFHPYRFGLSDETAVSSLWHWPSSGLNARIPDVIRHTALRSSDFPPPRNMALYKVQGHPRGSGRPAHLLGLCYRIRICWTPSSSLSLPGAPSVPGHALRCGPETSVTSPLRRPCSRVEGVSEDNDRVVISMTSLFARATLRLQPHRPAQWAVLGSKCSS